MHIPFSKLLFFPFILSGSFLFNYPVNANLQDSYQSRRPCTWDRAQYEEDKYTRYCVEPNGDVISIGFNHQWLNDMTYGKINRTERIWDGDLYEWRIEGDQLIQYECRGDHVSFDCKDIVKIKVRAYQIR